MKTTWISKHNLHKLPTRQAWSKSDENYLTSRAITFFSYFSPSDLDLDGINPKYYPKLGLHIRNLQSKFVRPGHRPGQWADQFFSFQHEWPRPSTHWPYIQFKRSLHIINNQHRKLFDFESKIFSIFSPDDLDFK